MSKSHFPGFDLHLLQPWHITSADLVAHPFRSQEPVPKFKAIAAGMVFSSGEHSVVEIVEWRASKVWMDDTKVESEDTEVSNMQYLMNPQVDLLHQWLWGTTLFPSNMLGTPQIVVCCPLLLHCKLSMNSKQETYIKNYQKIRDWSSSRVVRMRPRGRPSLATAPLTPLHKAGRVAAGLCETC